MADDTSGVTTSSLISFISSPTPGLRALVAQYRSTMSASAFEEVLWDIHQVFDKYTAKLLAAKPGVERAALLHRLMEHELKASAGMDISCRKGCGGCCHYEVEITQDEGDMLAEVVKQGHAIDFERLATQASYERKSPEWQKFWSPQNRCVFLSEQGACQVYEERPSVCRKHTVVSPSEFCTEIGAPIEPVQVPLAEILLSAALSIQGTRFGSLSKMLQKSLQIDAAAEAISQSPELTAQNDIPPLAQ